MKYTCRIICAILSVSIFSHPTNAQSRPITIGEQVTVHSQILNEDRVLLIYRPANYAASTARYPVIYLLDGDSHFHHATGIIEFLALQGRAPQMIVVGIANTDRNRDLTPPTDIPEQGLRTAGGAGQFLKCLTGEIIPYVEANYRTQAFRILIGHSFGGLFAVHTLFTQPETFDAYIAISPSLWWNNKKEAANASAFFSTHPDFQSFLYMTLGDEGTDMTSGMDAFTSVLKAKASKGFDWTYVPMLSENHGTTPHKTIYDGLEKLFKPLMMTASLADSGVAGIQRHYVNLSKRYGTNVLAPEAVVNTAGYRLLAKKQIPEAVAMFLYNTQLYPESPNVYDSLADAYEAANDLEKAATMCEKACALGNKLLDPNMPVFMQHWDNVRMKLRIK